MPLPPPPAAALTRDRVADRLGRLERGRRSTRRGSVVPGTTGTPAACISCRRAPILEPIASIASGGGPMNTRPAAAQARAKAAFSARKP